MRLYLSGPISGIPEHNKPAFNENAKILRDAGYEVLNPIELGVEGEVGWAGYLKRDIVELLKCEGVAVLDGWSGSKSASLEVHIGTELGMQIAPVGYWIGVNGMMWWKQRMPREATSDYLARALVELGAYPVAQKARWKHYDDYFCPESIDDGMNMQRLVRDIADWAYQQPDDVKTRRWAGMLIEAVKNGEFDGTTEEALAWQQSPQGKAIINELMGDVLKRQRRQ